MGTSKLSTMKSGIVYRRQAQNNDRTAKLSGQNAPVTCENALHATKGPDGHGYPIQVFNALLSQQVDEGRILEQKYKSVKELRNNPVLHDNADREDCNSPVTCEKTVREAHSQSRHDMVNHPTHYTQGRQDMVNHPSHYTQKNDVVNHPSHYCQGGIECIDAIQSAVTGLSGMQAVCAGNVIKYTWRYQFKNGAEDLRKARFYLDRLIRIVEKGGQ